MQCLPVTGHREYPAWRLQASLSPANARVSRPETAGLLSPATAAVPLGTADRRRAGARETSDGAEQPCGRRRGVRSKQWRRGGRSREEEGKRKGSGAASSESGRGGVGRCLGAETGHRALSRHRELPVQRACGPTFFPTHTAEKEQTSSSVT
jgi:hypothetical protein